MSRARGLLAALAAVLTGSRVYVHGAFAGHFFDLRGTDTYCTGGALAFPATEWSWVPLRHVCRYADGTTQELVPAWVHVVIGLAVLSAGARSVLAVRVVPSRCAIGAGRGRRRGRRARGVLGRR